MHSIAWTQKILTFIMIHLLDRWMPATKTHSVHHPQRRNVTTSIYSILFYSILGCVFPLQEVALCKSLPSFSVLCYPRPYRSLLPYNVISPMTFWSSDWPYTLCLPLCASNSPSVIFHSGDVSSPFPFRIDYLYSWIFFFFFLNWSHTQKSHQKWSAPEI